MRLHRAMWVGACLLLAAAGCSKDDKKINDVGVYSPIITGIGSNFEPAARGTANTLTAVVTNVNSLPLTYHWSVEAGTLGADSTGASVTWTPPDSVGTYDVTVSIEAQDGDQHFFKTMTVQMSVDNQYIRWTRSDQIQFDPAPTPGGGALYAEFHNIATGSSDAYRVDTPLGSPVQLTSGFFSVSSPTPRADQTDFAFTARKLSSEAGPSLYLLPFGGGDTAMARGIAFRNNAQSFLGGPRFARAGTRLAYASDSIGPDRFGNQRSGGVYTVRWRDAANLNVSNVSVVNPDDVAASIFTWMTSPSWGPDVDGDGNPDSVMALAVDFPGTFAEQTNSVYIYATPDSGDIRLWTQWLISAPIRDTDWSPDGKHVVFTLKNPGTNDRDIWIINRAAADISEAVRVTSGPADDSQPRFSHDGSQIFFVSNRVDRYGVVGVNRTERRGRNIWSVAQFDRP